jgi:hypothetical protein
MVFGAAFLVLLWRAPELARFLINPDQGYQLSLGQQILLGRFPFVDLTFIYGPLVAFTSAFGIYLFGNVIGEILICAFFYAASLTLIHGIARRRISPLAGWVLPILGLVLLARFHKWYVWFFPLAALYCCDRQLDDDDSHLRWWIVGGLVSGIGALFRLDYGIAILVFFSILALAPRLTSCSDGRVWRQRWVACATAFLAPMLLWLGILGAKGGDRAIGSYLHATFSGGFGAVVDWSRPPPEISNFAPFGLESAHFLALFLMPMTYLVCIALGAWRGYLRPGNHAGESRFVAAVGLLGLGIFPPGVYRADLSHLYQVLPPMLLAAAAVLRLGYRSLWGEDRIRSRQGRRVLGAVLGVYALLLAATLPLVTNPKSDLAPVGSDPIRRYRDLAGELSAAEDSSLMQAQIASLIVQETRPEDPILVIPYGPQIYYFSRRPMSGLLNSYLIGVHDDEITRRRNLEHVQRHPPALVVAPRRLRRMSPDSSFRRSQPELYEYLARRYTKRVEHRGRWVLLAPE